MKSEAGGREAAGSSFHEGVEAPYSLKCVVVGVRVGVGEPPSETRSSQLDDRDLYGDSMRSGDMAL